MSSQTAGSVSVCSQASQEREPLWAVVMLNDNWTPFDWVIDTLITLFGRTSEEALAVTQSVHLRGRGVAGVYPKKKALRLAAAAVRRAREAGHPFTCIAVPGTSGDPEGSTD